MKIVIIGGVAGGATAAARIRRLDEHCGIVMFERGPYVSFANCGLPYYIGDVISKRSYLLLATPKSFKDRYNIDVYVSSEAIGIDPGKKTVTVRNIKTGEIRSEAYDRLILSPGAKPAAPPIKGADRPNVFSLRTVPDSDRIKAYCDERRPKSSVIVGGGFIGLEMVENLVRKGVKTTVVEMLDQVLAAVDYEMAAMVQFHLKEKGVDCLLGVGVDAFEDRAGRCVAVTDQGHEIPCDMAVLSVGVLPETGLAKDAGLELGQRGAIKVDAAMRTSDPNIYAVGDAVETTDFIFGGPINIPLAGPANRQARIAADNVVGRKSVYKGALGTSIVKVFDLTVGSTGYNEKKLKKCGIPYRVSVIHALSHAGYYPDPETMCVKLLFSASDGMIFGAQIVGGKGVDKRIDVIATAIRGRMTVYDLEDLESAYAPPYGSAKDAVNMAGYVASNILKGDVEIVSWDEMDRFDSSETVLLDLRDRDELEEFGTIPGAIHVPVNKLRERMTDFNRDKLYIVFCAVGVRAYIGYRILVQNGFKVRNLSGGFSTYQSARAMQP